MLLWATCSNISFFKLYDFIRPGKIANNPTVNDIRVLKYEEEIITYKLVFDDQFLELPVRKRRIVTSNSSRCVPATLHKQRLPIPKTKFKAFLHFIT